MLTQVLNLRQLQVQKEQLNKGISDQQADTERFGSAVLFFVTHTKLFYRHAMY